MFVKPLLRLALVLVLSLAATGRAGAAVVLQTQGDTTAESVYRGFLGSGESLSDSLANYVNPTTHQPEPITRPTGGSLVVGDLASGQNPATCDQIQMQRFAVIGQDAQLKLTYLGLGLAFYRSVFGVYSYALGADPSTAAINMTPLFTQNQDTPGLTVTFTVPKDHAFGFYLNVDALNRSRGIFYTENFRNTDATAGVVTDHFLTFNTNRGLLLAIEDMGFNASTGLLGDQDYEDLLVGSLTYADGTPIDPHDGVIPEPASVALLLAGSVVLCRRPPRRERVILAPTLCKF
jgi:hypothetical protein